MPSPSTAPADLLTAQAGRPKDLEDVRGILLERLPRLDLELLRSTLAMLEAALRHSDLLPVLEAALARAKRYPTNAHSRPEAT